MALPRGPDGAAPVAGDVDEEAPLPPGQPESSRTEDATRPTYNAFISYSHAVDGKLAPAVQAGLHQLAKPWYRLRALRVFRDEASLSANPGLWSSIETALAGSEFFVLLASPQAARSEWVNREIGYWCANKPTRNILIAQTSGTVNWDDERGDFDWSTTTALPPTLRGVFGEEPRFIDFSWAHSVEQVSIRHARFRDCIADLASPMHGRPKDELFSDDVRQHRRTRHVVRATLAGVTTLAVIATIAAVIAVNQLGMARSRLQVARSRALAAEALVQQGTRLDRALLLSLEAYRQDDTIEARGALLSSLQRTPELLGYMTAGPEVNGLDMTRDGKMVATGNEDGSVEFWDVGSRGRLGTAAEDNRKPVNAVAFSPDSELLASAGADQAIVLWDTATRQPVGTPMRGHGEPIESVAFSPDGTLLASGGDDNTVRLWDLGTRTQVGQALEGHSGHVRSVVFSPDGSTLATGGADGRVIVWDAASRRPVSESPPRGAEVNAVAFSPDGQTLAIAYTDQVVVLTDPRTGSQIGDVLADPDGVTSVAFMAADRLVTAGYTGGMGVWDLKTQVRRGSSGGHEQQVSRVVSSPESGMVVSASTDGSLVLWDPDLRMRMGQPMRSEGRWTQERITSLAFTPDGRTFASAGAEDPDDDTEDHTDDHTVVLWDSERRIPKGDPLTGHSGDVNGVAFSPDGRTLASASADDTVVLWDTGSSQPNGPPLTGHAADVNGVAFSPDGRTLASAGADNTVRLWDPGTRLPKGDPLAGHSAAVTAVAFSPDGKTLASAGADRKVVLWDPETGRSKGPALDGHDGPVNGLAFSPDGRILASASEDRTVVLWDVSSRRQSGRLRGHIDPLKSVAFSPDGRTLASAGVDRGVVLWDVPSRLRLGQPFPGHTGVVRTVAFRPHSQILVSGAEDYRIIAWDAGIPSWRERACAIANRNLSGAEWDRFVDVPRPDSQTCPMKPGR